MSSQDRTVKREVRKRGSGKRDVHVDSFNITSNAISKKPKKKVANKLDSALIKKEDIDDLQRLRRRSSIVIGSAKLDVDKDGSVAPNKHHEPSSTTKGKTQRRNLTIAGNLMERLRGQATVKTPNSGNNAKSDRVKHVSNDGSPVSADLNSYDDDFNDMNEFKENDNIHGLASIRSGKRNDKSNKVPAKTRSSKKHKQDLMEEIVKQSKHRSDLLPTEIYGSDKDIGMTKTISEKKDFPFPTSRYISKSSRSGRNQVTTPRRIRRTSNEDKDEDFIFVSRKNTLTPRRATISRKSKPVKFKEIASDDDLDEYLENDSLTYTGPVRSIGPNNSKKNEGEKSVEDGDDNDDNKVIIPKIFTQSDQNEILGSITRNKISSIKETKFKQVIPRKSNRISRSGRASKSKLPIPTTARILRSRTVTPYKPPVPLSKTKHEEHQKPLVINVEKLIMNNSDKRFKVNTLNVLKDLIIKFQPTKVISKTVNEQLIQEDFKTHLLNHLDYLSDAHASINDISRKISEVQKLKNQLRTKIFELRKDHTKIGNELNHIRLEYKDEKDKFSKLNEMLDELSRLSSQTNDNINENGTSDSNHSKEQIDNYVSKELFTLNKLINPNSGIYKKLVLVNEKLSKLDAELS